MAKIHALLMAAGQSQRMGSPKQLLPWGAKTLIEHQIDILHQANLTVSVVLGANAENIKQHIDHLKIQIYINKDWQLGMGNSIAYGAKMLELNANEWEALLICLVDQPLITKQHYKHILNNFISNSNQIIVSQSDSGSSGPPVLFDTIYLKQLKSLDGDEGAKPIIKKHSENVLLLKSLCDLDDMDTPEAYQHLLNKFNLQS